MYIALYSWNCYYCYGGDILAEKYTEAQKRAILKYQANKVKIQILVTPEQREKYKALANSKELNLTQLIVNLLDKESGN